MIRVLRPNENTQTLLLVGCKKMGDVKCLNLSDTRLQSLQLDIFEMLPCLEELDLSNNDIRNLELQTTSSLVSLNCSHNQLSDVQFLCSFPNLEELHMDGNPDLTFADRYIAACLCPRLKCLDGSSIIQIDDLNKEYEEKLWPQVVSVWENQFEGNCKPFSMTDVQFADLRQDFTDKVHETKLYGEDELEKFRNFKVKNMITEIMMCVRSKVRIPRQPKRKAFTRGDEANGKILTGPCKFQKNAQTPRDQSPVVNIVAKLSGPPLPAEDQLDVIVPCNDGDTLSDDEVVTFRKLCTNVIRSCTPSIEEVSIVNNDDSASDDKISKALAENLVVGKVKDCLPSDPLSTNEDAAEAEILTCPRKLQVTLKKLNDKDWVRTSPSPVKSPLKKQKRLLLDSGKQDLIEPRQRNDSTSTKDILQRELFRNCVPNSSIDNVENGEVSPDLVHDPKSGNDTIASPQAEKVSGVNLRSKSQPNANVNAASRRSPRKSPRKVYCASPVTFSSASETSDISLQMLSSLSDGHPSDNEESSESVISLHETYSTTRDKNSTNAKHNHKRLSTRSKPSLPSHTYKKIQSAIESQDADSASDQECSSTSTIQPNDSKKICKRIMAMTEFTDDDADSGPTKISRKKSKNHSTSKNTRLSDRITKFLESSDDDIDMTNNPATDSHFPPTNSKSSSAKHLNGVQLNDTTAQVTTRSRPGSSISVTSQGVLSPLDRRRLSVTSNPPPPNKTLEAQTKIVLPPTKHWTPRGFYRCHSVNNSAEDESTQVWHCAFEPDPCHPGKTKHILATCGGRSVSFLDCSTGSVIARYKHFKPEEELFALAWTTLRDENDKDINILAVAGRCSEIHLIHRHQLVCFASLEKVSEFINSLAFHPSCPTYLCSGQADGNVVCWDITPPTLPNYKCECSKLFTVSTNCTILSLAFTLDGNYTLSGGEGGCFGWPVKTANNSKNRIPAVEFVHPLNGGEGDEVDSVVIISSEIIATKVASRSCIYLWNFASTLQSKKNSRGTVKLSIQMVAVLEWSRTQDVCLRMDFCRDASLLACGDSSGQIWLYKLDKILQKAPSKQPASTPAYSPSEILSWPPCSYNRKMIANSGQVTMNKVAFSSDGRYLGAVTDHNLVCIWE